MLKFTSKEFSSSVSVPPEIVAVVVVPSEVVAGHVYWSTVAILPFFLATAVAPHDAFQLTVSSSSVSVMVTVSDRAGIAEPSEQLPLWERTPV